MKTPWTEVMRELVGRRLAVLDELLHGRPIDRADPRVSNALGWLAYHRFVYPADDGQLCARRPADAHQVWSAEGALDEKTVRAVTDFAHEAPKNEQPLGGESDAPMPAESAGTQPAAAQGNGAPRLPVQSHQAEFFALEGYRAS